MTIVQYINQVASFKIFFDSVAAGEMIFKVK